MTARLQPLDFPAAVGSVAGGTLDRPPVPILAIANRKIKGLCSAYSLQEQSPKAVGDEHDGSANELAQHIQLRVDFNRSNLRT